MSQIVEPRYPKHSEAISYINRLVIDLKLELAGVEHDPITPERLAEWAEHRADLERCTERHQIRYAKGKLGDYRRARGAIPWKEGDEPAAVVIRRMRGG